MTLRTILAENGFRVLGEASNGHESVRVCGELKPDIAVLDLSMPILSDLEAVRMIKIHHPPTKVIILAVCAAGLHLLESLALGASAYITKYQAAGRLLDAVEAVSERDIYVRLASNDYLMTMSPSAAEHPRLASRIAPLPMRMCMGGIGSQKPVQQGHGFMEFTIALHLLGQEQQLRQV